MLVIRNVFRCKPGQAKTLVKMMKETIANAPGRMGNARVMTDLAAGFWTVVMESEAESLAAWEQQFEAMSANSDERKPMQGYLDLVEGGHREIFRIE